MTLAAPSSTLQHASAGPMGNEGKTGRIGALDGWRGLAILLVLVDHAGEMMRKGRLHTATRTGATGVGIFFALSGFLITTILLAEQNKFGHIDLLRFYLRRVFRLLPSVLVFLGALFILRELHILPMPGVQLLAPLLLFRNYISGDWGVGWYTSHFWSLTVEEHFYLIWPLLLLATRANVKVLTAIALGIAAWREVSLHYRLFPGLWAPGRTDIRIDSILWGCILAIVLAHPQMREKLTKVFSGWVLFALLIVDVVSNILHGQHYYSAFEPVILALLVVWPILHPASALRRFLDLPALRAVGAISYSLYIWQQMWLLFPGVPVLFPRLQTFPVNLVVSFLCAIASYLLVEQPFIRLGRRVVPPAGQSANPSEQVAAA
jgi:peptidoglycan/LPS O-acetylase OafA/YrhL